MSGKLISQDIVDVQFNERFHFQLFAILFISVRSEIRWKMKYNSSTKKRKKKKEKEERIHRRRLFRVHSRRLLIHRGPD